MHCRFQLYRSARFTVLVKWYLRGSFGSSSGGGLLGGSGGRSIGSRLLRLSLLLLGSILSGSSLSIATVRRSPEGQVVTQQLHDQGAVTVRLLRQRVKLGNGIVESLLGQVASPVRRVQDLVIEDGEVQGKTQADRVGRSELSLGNIGSVLREDMVS